MISIAIPLILATTLVSPKAQDLAAAGDAAMAKSLSMPSNIVVTNQTATFTLAWLLPSDSSVIGCKLYHATNYPPSNFVQIVSVGIPTNTVTVTLSAASWDHFFATTFSASGSESIPSEMAPPAPSTNVVLSWNPPGTTQLQTSTDLLHWTVVGTVRSPITNAIQSGNHFWRGGAGVTLSIRGQ